MTSRQEDLRERLPDSRVEELSGGEEGHMVFYGTYSTTACATESELSDVGRIRYEAYRSVDAIAPNDGQSFLDDYDRRGNSKSLLIKEKDDAIAAIRASVYDPRLGFAPIPCQEAYGDDLERHIGGLDKTVVESNRFVIRPHVTDSARLFKLQFRFIILNILKYDADFVVTAVRPRHVRFYERILMYPISEPKAYPGLTVEMVLLAGDCRQDLQAVIRRDPIYTVSRDEMDGYSICAPALTFS